VKPKEIWFELSESLPIYSFAIYAGPYLYHEEDQSETIEDGDQLSIPPMKIYARKSLIDKVDHK
jgi:hypothetical protein